MSTTDATDAARGSNGDGVHEPLDVALLAPCWLTVHLAAEAANRLGRRLLIAGKMAEPAEDGVTGFVAEDMDELVAAIDKVDAIDPADCRRSVENRFSIDAMVSGDEDVYASVGA